MAKELPILPASSTETASQPSEKFIYSRVFCQRENSPPLRLLIDFLTARGHAPIMPPGIEASVLDEWAWVQIALGYSRDRQPIQLFCVRDRGSYKDIYEQEKALFLELLSAYDGVEPELVRGHLSLSRFIMTTRMVEKDVTDEGFDFNGWILEFYQEQCNGIVQIDNHGFYSPTGDLIIDMSLSVED